MCDLEHLLARTGSTYRRVSAAIELFTDRPIGASAYLFRNNRLTRRYVRIARIARNVRMGFSRSRVR